MGLKRWRIRFRNANTKQHVVTVSRVWATDSDAATQYARERIAKVRDVEDLEPYYWELY